jgi:dTDP-glucose 4,6-dehydratase
VNVDKLTYAGNLQNLASLTDDPCHVFVRADVNDGSTLRELLESYRPQAIVHFAAESHVDRSIQGPGEFIRTNIEGTFHLLEEARAYWCRLGEAERQVSTDEVYGTLGPNDPAFSEQTPYAPNSPYAASKAAADHLVRAYYHTYGLPVLTTNCSNNYGPRQFPEKLIPLMILNALRGITLPVYGDGLNVRDWLYVGDHCAAVRTVLDHGRVGETYNIGGSQEVANIDVIRMICAHLQECRPVARNYDALITYVKDRPGHDRRYAMNASKLQAETGWAPKETFSSGLRKTVDWYLENMAWVESVLTGEYQQWCEKQYEISD